MIPTCNIVKCNCELKIPPGYDRCYLCGGTGCLLKGASFKEKRIMVIHCPVCKTEGIVDWVTASTKPKVSNYYYHTINISFRCGAQRNCKVIKRWARDIFK